MQDKCWVMVLCCFLVIAGCGRIPKIVFLTDPLTAEEHNDLGVSYEQRGEYTWAEREYKEALRIKKNFFNAQFNLGNVYLKMGRENDAEKAYKGAIALDPARPDPYNNMACIYRQAGRNLKQAQEWAEKAVSLGGPRRYRYLDTLGMVHFAAGKVDEAMRCLEEAATIMPVEDQEARVELYKHLVQVYRLKGDVVRAQKYLDEIERLTAASRSD